MTPKLKAIVLPLSLGNNVGGSQLSKEATDQYEMLVKNGLEQGKERAGTFYHKADFEIGIDIETGRPTSYYRIDDAPLKAHVIPTERAAKVIAKIIRSK